MNSRQDDKKNNLEPINKWWFSFTPGVDAERHVDFFNGIRGAFNEEKVETLSHDEIKAYRDKIIETCEKSINADMISEGRELSGFSTNHVLEAELYKPVEDNLLELDKTKQKLLTNVDENFHWNQRCDSAKKILIDLQVQSKILDEIQNDETRLPRPAELKYEPHLKFLSNTLIKIAENVDQSFGSSASLDKSIQYAEWIERGNERHVSEKFIQSTNPPRAEYRSPDYCKQVDDEINEGTKVVALLNKFNSIYGACLMERPKTDATNDTEINNINRF